MTLINKMEIKEEYTELYNQLKSNMLFACIWEERPQGGYNRFDYRPFIALKKVENQGVIAYEGHYIDVCKKKGSDGYAILNKDRTFQRQITIDESEVYKPLAFFNEDGDERIIVSSDLDEICELYLKRFQDIKCKTHKNF